jgi:hypothetical protein
LQRPQKKKKTRAYRYRQFGAAGKGDEGRFLSGQPIGRRAISLSSYSCFCPDPYINKKIFV